MRELPSPGPPDECPRCERTGVGLYIITGTGDDHRHLCGDCLATVARIELPQHDRRTCDPRVEPGNCAEAALWEAAGGTEKEAALEHGLAAVNELQVRIDRAREDAAHQLVQLATARAGAYADIYPEGAGMVAAYDDLIEELEDELLPAVVEQLRTREDTLDALGRQIRRLQAQLADRPAVNTGRTATRDEVFAVRRVLRALAEHHGLTAPRVDAHGAVIVTMSAAEPGYGALRRFAAAVSEVMGVWVTVVADDAPGAATDTSPL
ncbi:hypothetical protein [Blastococcus sp. SYSU DS1024]